MRNNLKLALRSAAQACLSENENPNPEDVVQFVLDGAAAYMDEASQKVWQVCGSEVRRAMSEDAVSDAMH